MFIIALRFKLCIRLFCDHQNQLVDILGWLACVHGLVSEIHKCRHHQAHLASVQFNNSLLYFLSEHILHLTFFLYDIRKK